MNEEDIITRSLNKITFQNRGIGDLINEFHPNKLSEVTVSPEAIIVSLKEAIKLTKDASEAKDGGNHGNK